MCCFTGPVRSVAHTMIFARGGDAGRQFLAYRMSVEVDAEVAMVLPLPVPADSAVDAVIFIDLSGYKEFFADLTRAWPAASTAIPPAATPGRAAAKAKPLPVVEVGNFEASFVPAVADFARLDERFRLPAGTWDKLPAYRAFGFAVFKLKPGRLEAHPLALSFPRANPKQLFFPTVHIHDGEVHDKAAFDHTLFCQPSLDVALDLLDWEESPGLANSSMKLDAAKGLVAADQHLYKHALNGELANRDTLVAAR